MGEAEALTITDGESNDHVAGGLIVEHFRIDPSRRLIRAMVTGSLVMALGSLAVAAALAFTHLDTTRPVHGRASRPTDGLMRGAPVTADGTPIERDWMIYELLLGTLGLGCIVLGGGSTIVLLNRVLREERYLALRTDGAYLRLGDERELLRWEDVGGVRWDPERRVVAFELHDGSEWTRAERYAGIDGAELARRASDVRRKALFGLL